MSADEAGSGLLPAATGVLVFLLLMLVAVQVLTNLYAVSAVQSAAFDAARVAAGADAPKDDAAGLAVTRRAAEEQVRSILGRYGRDHVRAVVLDYDGEEVTLTVHAESPALLPRLLAPAFALGRVDRTVHVRAERPR